MSKINSVERIQYAGGLYGLLFGSSKGKLAAKVMDMNSNGWNLHTHPFLQKSLSLLQFSFFNLQGWD